MTRKEAERQVESYLKTYVQYIAIPGKRLPFGGRDSLGTGRVVRVTTWGAKSHD